MFPSGKYREWLTGGTSQVRSRWRWIRPSVGVLPQTTDSTAYQTQMVPSHNHLGLDLETLSLLCTSDQRSSFASNRALVVDFTVKFAS